jgi:peptide/nickel transport system ATP-binding protein
VSIARALVVEPSIILADEPVSMLDVSTQASILKLLSRLIDDLNVALLYISHDLSTVSYISDVTNVMYLGRIIETAPTEQLLSDPKHPYSKALINAVSIPDPHHERERTILPGAPDEPAGMGDGCRFKDRCPQAMDICEQTPRSVETGAEHRTACHLYYDHEGSDEGIETSSQEAHQ